MKINTGMKIFGAVLVIAIVIEIITIIVIIAITNIRYSTTKNVAKIELSSTVIKCETVVYLSDYKDLKTYSYMKIPRKVTTDYNPSYGTNVTIADEFVFAFGKTSIEWRVSCLQEYVYWPNNSHEDYDIKNINYLFKPFITRTNEYLGKFYDVLDQDGKCWKARQESLIFSFDGKHYSLDVEFRFPSEE